MFYKRQPTALIVLDKMQNLETIGDAVFEILKETFSINSNQCQAKFLTYYCLSVIFLLRAKE